MHDFSLSKCRSSLQSFGLQKCAPELSKPICIMASFEGADD